VEPKAKKVVCAKCAYHVTATRWGIAVESGKLFTCECGTRFITGKIVCVTTLYHMIFQRKIAADRSVLSWQYFPRMRKVYLTCTCGPLLPILLTDIDDNGYVGGTEINSCTSCPYCQNHFWPYLEGWKELALKRKKAKEQRLASAARRKEAAEKEAVPVFVPNEDVGEAMYGMTKLVKQQEA